jgi:hypothetical protein
MRRVIIAISVIALAAAIAPPAAASQSTIAFGVARTLTPADIAKRLGAVSPNYSVEIFPDYRSDWILCSTRNPSKPMVFSGMDTEIRVGFPRPGRIINPVNQSIFQFSTTEKARQAFETVQTRVKRCVDTVTDASDPTDEFQFSRTSAYSNGTVTAVPNVPTVFVNEDFTYTAGGSDDGNVSQDSFTTYSLVNDAIIAVSFQRSPIGSITKKERKGVDNTTAAAIRNYQRTSAPKPRSLQASYAYGVDHFITPRDVPAVLIRPKGASVGSTNLNAKQGRLFLCDPQGIQFSDDADTAPFVGINAARVEMSSNITNNKSKEVQQTVYGFATEKKARKAFTRMEKAAKGCTRTTTSTETGEGDGDGQPFSVTFERTYTNATDPAVTVNNVPSIALGSRLTVRENSTSQTSTSSSYGLLTLVGSNIMSLTFERENAVSAKQRAATQELANAAVKKWLAN